MDGANTLHDAIFGATAHDPAFWDAHPLVVQSEVHFDEDGGWVGVSTRAARETDCPSVSALLVEPKATREEPDLYFWGEGQCPIGLFEHAPRVKELRIAIEGPVQGDDRTCWSAGLWLAAPARVR